MYPRIWAVTVVIAGVAFAAVVGVAFFDWPSPQLRPADVALARVVLPGFSGRVSAVSVRGADGTSFPVRIRVGRLWPVGKIPAGERLNVAVTVRRPVLGLVEELSEIVSRLRQLGEESLELVAQGARAFVLRHL